MCVLKALPTALLNVANGAGVAENQVPLGGGLQGCPRRRRPASCNFFLAHRFSSRSSVVDELRDDYGARFTPLRPRNTSWETRYFSQALRKA